MGTCDDVTGAMYPSPGSERRLARVSRYILRGAYRTLGQEESPSGSGRRHAWNSRPTGRYRNLGSSAQHSTDSGLITRAAPLHALVCARYGGRLPVLYRFTPSQYENAVLVKCDFLIQRKYI